MKKIFSMMMLLASTLILGVSCDDDASTSPSSNYVGTYKFTTTIAANNMSTTTEYDNKSCTIDAMDNSAITITMNSITFAEGYMPEMDLTLPNILADSDTSGYDYYAQSVTMEANGVPMEAYVATDVMINANSMTLTLNLTYTSTKSETTVQFSGLIE
ncbi:MAG: hypothetical protein SNH41_01450 [Rikenellaceae bacterium]